MLKCARQGLTMRVVCENFLKFFCQVLSLYRWKRWHSVEGGQGWIYIVPKQGKTSAPKQNTQRHSWSSFLYTYPYIYTIQYCMHMYSIFKIIFIFRKILFGQTSWKIQLMFLKSCLKAQENKRKMFISNSSLLTTEIVVRQFNRRLTQQLILKWAKRKTLNSVQVILTAMFDVF